MVPELEKPRVTEIQVRMDCNGCVQKIRKALHGIHGIYEVYPDIAQQKLTVIGWADPEKIVKAIRKTRKIATICSNSEPTETTSEQPSEQAPPEGGPPENPPPSEAPPAEAVSQPQPQPEAAPPAEPPKDPPPPEPSPTPACGAAAGTDTNANPNPNANQQPPQPSGPKDDTEVHVICHHPPDYGHRYGYVHDYIGPWSRQYPNNQGNFYHYPDQSISRHPNSQVFHHEPPQPPAFITHSYNTYSSSPYVTEYEYFHSPPPYTHYSRIDHYNEDYHNNYSSSSSNNGNGNGNITSIFSDENPNACRIM